MDWILWIFWIIFQWVLLLAPAVVLRKYRRRPMNKGQAIGYSAAICLITYILWFLSAYVLGGFDPAMNPGPFALSSLFSFWILRKATVLDGDASLKMLDRVFKKIFPETNTPRPPQAQRGQNSQAAKSKHEISDEKLPDQFHAPLKNKSKAEKAGNYIRDYVVSPPRPHDMQLQKVSPTDESNMTTTPEIDEDALYEQAFNELQGEERVVSTWSRAFAEAAGDEQKAKALYISARVSSLKQELSAKFEAGRLEAERREADRFEGERLEADRLSKAEAEAEGKAQEEAAAKEIEDVIWEKNIDEYRKMLIESGMNTVLAVGHTRLMAPKETRQQTLLLIDGLRKGIQEKEGMGWGGGGRQLCPGFGGRRGHSNGAYGLVVMSARGTKL